MNEINEMKDKVTALVLNQIAEKVIGYAYKVSNTLGCGFLEKVYEKALIHEIKKAGLKVAPQFPMTVHYDGEIVGEYMADLLVEDCLLLELKAVETLDKIHFDQCLNYLKATGLNSCLLINFGRPKIQVKRFNSHFDQKQTKKASNSYLSSSHSS